MSEYKKQIQGPSLRDKLHMTSNAIIKINGHEIKISEYMLDPKKYNSMPMKEEFIQEIIEECKKSQEDKEKLLEFSSIKVD